MSSVYVSKSMTATIRTKTVYEVVRTRSQSVSADDCVGGSEHKEDVVAVCVDHETAKSVLQSILSTESRGDDEREKAQLVNAGITLGTDMGPANMAGLGALQSNRRPR